MNRKLKELLGTRMSRDSVQEAVDDADWQDFRESLLGLPTDEKLDLLDSYLRKPGRDDRREVRVSNYLKALKRGGLLHGSNSD